MTSHRNSTNKRVTTERALKKAINDFDEPLFRARGIHIIAFGTGRRGSVVKATLTLEDTKKTVAWIDVTVDDTNNGKNEFLKINEGWTPVAYRRKGYGTIIRALVCKAAKNIGLVSVEQMSSALERNNANMAKKVANAYNKLRNPGPNNNIASLKKIVEWRPPSAYIMNKLGFNKTQMNVGYNSYSEYRTLKLGNLPTPKLNAVVQSILH